LRRLTDQVTKADGTSISPLYLFDREVHHRVPAPRVQRGFAQTLELDYDRLLALVGASGYHGVGVPEGIDSLKYYDPYIVDLSQLEALATRAESARA
jgi:hypothetical protein